MSTRGSGGSSLNVDCNAMFNASTTITTLTASVIDVSLQTTSNRIYVDLSGSDSSGDGTVTKPFRSILKALETIVSSSTPSLSNTFGVIVGTGQFEELQLTVPSYVGIYGVGTGTTKVKAAAADQVVFDLVGDRTRLESLTVLGVSTGSNNTGIRSNDPAVSYIDAPRIQNLMIMQCTTAVHIASASSLVAFDVRAWDNKVGFYSDNGDQVDLYGCYAYQLSDVRAPDTVGIKSVCASQTQYVYLFSFNTWNNEIAIQAYGTAVSKGGLVYGANLALESEGTALQVNHAARVDVSDYWSKNCVTLEIEQKSATAAATLRNASIDYSKFSLYAGGENNIKIFGVDVNVVDTLRLRGNEPALQLRNLNTDATAGGLYRVILEPARLCFERNTHVSGAFATYVDDMCIDATGSIAVGEVAHWNRLDVSGSVAAHNDGYFKLYQNVLSGTNFIALRVPASLSVPTYYTLPQYPTGTFYLVCDVNGMMGWSAGSSTGEANTASNLVPDFGLYASKSGVDLRFKSLVAGANITLTSGSNTITIDASASGEANTASNLAPDFGLYASKSGVDLRFKSLVAGPGIALTSGSNTITLTVSGSGEVITGSNVGSGVGVFKQKNISTLEFYSIESPTGSLGNVLSASLNPSRNTIQITRRPLSRTLLREDDFLSSTSVGVLNWLETTSGPGSLVAPSTVGIDTTPDYCAGVFELRTGTNTSGRAAITTYTSAYRLDFFESTMMEWRIMLQSLSTATQEYTFYVGWLDNAAAGDQVDGIYFEYNRLTHGTNWMACAATNSTRTKVTTTATVSAGTSFSRMKIITHSGSLSADFYVNDALVGSVSSSMPLGTGRLTGFGAKIEKSAGTTSRSSYLDYVQVMCNWPSNER